MCQSESPNEAGNTWLVGWMISTGWYLKTRENQESSQQKTHTLLPSIRMSLHNWHIYYIGLETPIIAGDICFPLRQHEIACFDEIVEHIIKSLQSHIVGMRKHSSACWGCIRLLAEWAIFSMWLLKCCFQCAQELSSCDDCPVVSWHFLLTSSPF